MKIIFVPGLIMILIYLLTTSIITWMQMEMVMVILITE